jgi:hypothetical protein
VLLSALLGKDAIRPPKGKILVPDLSKLQKLLPKLRPDGRPLVWAPAAAVEVEAAQRPGAQDLACKRKFHWHKDGLYHADQAWGRWDGSGWLWLKREQARWWAWPGPGEPTWLEHSGHWWWSSGGIWFMLHEGQAWGYRLFQDSLAEGLIHPASGTTIIYSSDGLRAAVVTPDDGAWLFDARTGEILGRWTQAQMPAKPKPRAPAALKLPP